MAVNFQRGVDGQVSISGVTAKLTRWALVTDQAVVDTSGFGDAGNSTFAYGKKVHQVSIAGEVQSSTRIASAGTAYIWLGYTGGTAKYEGRIVYNNLQEGPDYKSGNNRFTCSGVVDGALGGS